MVHDPASDSARFRVKSVPASLVDLCTACCQHGSPYVEKNSGFVSAGKNTLIENRTKPRFCTVYILFILYSAPYVEKKRFYTVSLQGLEPHRT